MSSPMAWVKSMTRLRVFITTCAEPLAMGAMLKILEKRDRFRNSERAEH